MPEEEDELTETGERAIKSVAKGAGIVFVGLIFSKLMGYVYNIVAARYLGADGYGLISLATAVLSFVSVFCILGLNHGINRYASFYKGKENEERTKGSIFSGLTMVFSATLAVTIILFFISDFLATVIFNEPGATLIFQLFSLTLPFYVSLKVFTSVTDAYQKMKYRIISSNILMKGSKALLVILFVVFLGFDVLGVAYAYLFSYILGALVIVYFTTTKILPELKDVVPKPNYRELLTYSWPLLFVAVMGTVLSKTDQIMLGYFLDSGQVGIYRAALLTAAVLTVVLSALRKITLPVLSDLLGKDKKKEFTRTFKTSVKWAFVSTLPLFVVLVLFAPQVMDLIFGSEYVAGATALSVLAVTYFVKACFGLSTSLLKSLEKTKLILIATVSSGLLNVILNAFLIPRYEMVGAATAYFISIVLLYSLYLFFGHKHLKTNPFKLSLVKSLLAALFSAPPVYLVFRHLLAPVRTWMFPVAFILYLGLYILLFLVMKGLDNDDTLVLKAVEKKTGIKIEWLRNFIKRFI